MIINKKIILIISIIFFSILLSIIFISIETKKPNIIDTSLSNSYIDPGTGETIYTQTDKTPEIGSKVSFIGFEKLIDFGLTSNQLDLIKYHIGEFSTINSIDISEISIFYNSISLKINKTNGINNITFQSIINRDLKYNIKINYKSINDLSINIYNLSNKLLYNSVN